jgi:hypothetical protein
MEAIERVTEIINEGWNVFKEENQRNYSNHKFLVDEYRKLTGTDLSTCFCHARNTFDSWAKYLKGIGKIG